MPSNAFALRRTRRSPYMMLFFFTVLLCTTGWLSERSVLAGGTLDSAFGNGGKVVTPISDVLETTTLLAQPDGKLIAIGTVYSGPMTAGDVIMVRYNADGSLDNSFGVGGKVVTVVSTGYDYARGATLQPDGKIVVVGYISQASSDLMVLRYNTNGSLDTRFGNGGIVITNQSPRDELHAVAIQPDGKIVAVGITDGLTVARYNSDGSLENLFFTDFSDVVPGLAFNYGYRAVAILPDGRIIAGGFVSTNPGNLAVTLARYNADGSLDTSFGASAGRMHVLNNVCEDIALLPDGKFLISGWGVQRFLNNGALDPSFSSTATGGKLALLPNGQIAVMENFIQIFLSSIHRVKLLRSDGGLIGRVTIPREDGADISVQPDGKIVTFSKPITAQEFVLHRYLTITSLSVQADFDADERTDLGVFRPSEGSWYIKRNNLYGFDKFSGYQAGDWLAPGDYNGDTQSDVMVWRAEPSAGAQGYFCRDLGISPNCKPWGVFGDIPVGGDYDSDGKTDFAVYRNGVWHVLQSSSNSYRSITFGLPTDKPVPGDYDHDGQTDAAVFRPSNGTWYVLLSSNNAVLAQPFGLSTDKLVPGDYDGDGKTDFAVFRPDNGTWYLLQSSAGFRAEAFGLSTDRPVPGDYDGDGRADIGVFRNGTWYLLPSTGGFMVEQFGLAGDIPLTPGYVFQ